MAKLGTQPYKGTRDFYPEDMRIQRYIFDVWRTVSERYGYEEYNAPMLELTELYRAKTGEEIVNEQSYTFTDRGGREVTIRPEMTPSLARMVAARQQELAYPLRWYSIANFWRYERPQRGRLREFWQLNVDIFGVKGIEAEFEMIKMAASIMESFGAEQSMYKIRINSRKLLGLLLGEYLGLDVAKAHQLTKLLDRKSKMSEAAFKAQAKAIIQDVDKLQSLLNTTKLEDLPANVVESGLVEELRGLLNQLKDYGVKNAEFDLTLMRGFDYYTGIVFEVFDTNTANPRSLFGGGRYDELTSIFGKTPLPAIGFAPGDIGIYNFLQTHNLLPAYPSTTDVYVAAIGDTATEVQEVASSLRKAGINVAVDVTDRKVEAKIKTAVKQEVPYVVFVGKEEVSSKQYVTKDLRAENELKLSISEITKLLAK